MKRALIIGASGQVGTALTRYLGAENVLPTFNAHPVPGGVQLDLLTVDNAGAAGLLADQSIDTVYCCGAATHVDACEDDEPRALRINAEGPAILARAAAR